MQKSKTGLLSPWTEDLGGAFQFYRKNGSGKLALRFLAEFERVAELVERNPDIGTPANDGRRSHPFRKYPYSLIAAQSPSIFDAFTTSPQRASSDLL